MLEIRPTCENCNKSLPPDSTEAMICTFECTYCKECVEKILKNVCPNCRGGFQPRPVRPKAMLRKYPFVDKVVYNPVDITKHNKLVEKYSNISPELR